MKANSQPERKASPQVKPTMTAAEAEWQLELCKRFEAESIKQLQIVHRRRQEILQEARGLGIAVQ